MNPKLSKTYMDIARRFAQNSYAKRLKVGAVIVTNDIMVPGYNGTPEGWDNNCEDKVWMDGGAGGWLDPETIEKQWPFTGEHPDSDGVMMEGRYKLVTKPEVLHAESNALSKIAKSTLSANGATLFVTHSPCIHCAKSIYQAGIKTVYYETDYRSIDGVQFLKNSGVNVIKMDE